MELRRPAPLAKPVKITIILVLIILPFVVLYISWMTDPENNDPLVIDREASISSPPLAFLIENVPINTRIVVNVTVINEVPDFAVSFELMNRGAYLSFTGDEGRFGESVSKNLNQLVLTNTIDAEVQTAGDYYLVIYQSQTTDPVDVDIKLWLYYEAFLIRQSFQILWYFGAYIIIAYAITGFYNRYMRNRWIRKLEEKREQEEREFILRKREELSR